MTKTDGTEHDDGQTSSSLETEADLADNSTDAPEVVEPPLNMQTMLQIQASSFSGPLPPPQILERYEEVLKGAADRIFVMAEAQSEHRQRLEAKVVDGNVEAQRRGPIIGGVLVLAALVVAIVAILNDYPFFGFAAFFTAFAAVLAVTLRGQTKRDADIRSREEDEDS